MVIQARQYSNLFSCLYDEARPVGQLGRGTHYSVMRAVEWRDVDMNPVQQGQIHDFAVVWDEDHDERIIDAIEHIYLSGLLSPVQFIGERKGTLTVIVAAKYYFGNYAADDYANAINEIAQGMPGDPWHAVIGMFDRRLGSQHQTDPETLINDNQERVITYLRNIDNLWTLGTKLPWGGLP